MNANAYSMYDVNQLYKMYYAGDESESLVEELMQQLSLYFHKSAQKYRKSVNYDDIIMEAVAEAMVLVRTKKVNPHHSQYNFIGYCSYCFAHASGEILKEGQYPKDMIVFSLDDFVGDGSRKNEETVSITSQVSSSEAAMLEDVFYGILKDEGVGEREIEWFFAHFLDEMSFVEIGKESGVSDSYVSRKVKECQSILKNKY